MDGQRNKRLACDRCRTQKLKCIRQEASEICWRCATAKTLCIFGIQLPPGRTPKPRPITSEGRRDGRKAAATAFSQSDSEMATFPPDFEESFADDPNTTENITPPITTTGMTRQEAASYHWGSWAYLDDENSFSMVFDDITMGEFNSSALALGSRSTNGCEDLSVSLQQATGHPSDSSGDAMHLIDPDLPTELTNSMPLPSARKTRSVLNKKSETTTKSSQSSSTPQLAVPSAILTAENPSDSSHSSNGPALMQKLMELSSTMYELQSIYTNKESGGQNVPSDIFPSDLAGNVLRIALQFRETLRGLLHADDPPDSPPLSHNNQPSFHDGWSSLSGQDEVEDMNFHRHNNQNPALLDLSTRNRSDCVLSHCYRQISTVDKPTALQLVSNYLRLLQLYHLLFDAVREHICVPESRFHNRKPIWTDLTVGNAPLAQFADIQIKLVLQVAERVLEEIENALGLAEGSRVSRELDKKGNGKLRMSVTTHIIDMCIRDFTTESEHDSGIIAKLRDLMHYFSLVLK